jgi:hypothetical protein
VAVEAILAQFVPSRFVRQLAAEVDVTAGIANIRRQMFELVKLHLALSHEFDGIGVS